MELNSKTEWVAQRLALVRPEWQPKTAWAKTRLRARMEKPRTRGRWAMAAAAAIAMLAIMAEVPQGRIVAQELWYRWFLRSFDVVRLDLSRIPLAVSITSNEAESAVVTLDEAERRAGFRPALPPHELVGDAPARLSVTGPIGIRQTVKVREMREALVRAGASEVQIPAEWQGVMLRMDIAPMVIAEYKGEVQIVQSRPIQFETPAGFPLAKFAETAIRCAGVSAWRARAMGEKFANNPAWLLDIPENEVVEIEEIPLRAGNGLLVADRLEDGGSRVTILFGTTDRIFSVSSSSRERSLRIANSLL